MAARPIRCHEAADEVMPHANSTATEIKVTKARLVTRGSASMRLAQEGSHGLAKSRTDSRALIGARK
jgi:hypothetical protein